MKSTLGTGALSWVSDSSHCRALLFNAVQSSTQSKQEHMRTTVAVGQSSALSQAGTQKCGTHSLILPYKDSSEEWAIRCRAARENRAPTFSLLLWSLPGWQKMG